MEIPSGRKVKVHYNDGTIKEAANGKLQVGLDKVWQHQLPLIIGLTSEELQQAAVFEPYTQQIGEHMNEFTPKTPEIDFNQRIPRSLLRGYRIFFLLLEILVAQSARKLA